MGGSRRARTARGAVSEEEVKKLWKAFQRLDEVCARRGASREGRVPRVTSCPRPSTPQDRSGQISRAEFMQVPSIATNPLVQRVMAVLDKDNDNEISFTEFVTALSVFSSTNEGDKLKSTRS